MANLFNLTQESILLANELEDNLGELTPELSEALEINQENAKAKIAAYYYIIKQAKGDIATANVEIERLKGVTKSKETLIERLENVLLFAIQQFGTSKVSKTTGLTSHVYEDDLFKLTSRTSERIEVTSDFYKEEYMKYKLKDNLTFEDKEKIATLLGTSTFNVEVDKSKLKADIKTGKTIENAYISTNESLSL